MNDQNTVFEGIDLTRQFNSGKNKTIAVNRVNFSFHYNEIVSVVGESGSGKTTLAKMLLGLLAPTSGEIRFEGKPRDISTHAKKKEYWKGIQAVFQDPFSTFNIFAKIDSVLLDCIKLKGDNHLSREEKTQQMKDACSMVNLKFEEMSNKYPFELSGGQMQRLMLARIFMLRPKVLIADEPTSMIDACSRATILDMLLQLREDIGMTIVFITHDIGLAYHISDSVYIMEHGNIVESGTADEVILNSKAEYTKKLINDVPKINEPWDFTNATLV